MTNNYMETSFNIENGIQIDELKVDSFSENKLPHIFTLKESFVLRRKSDFAQSEKLSNILFFDKPNKGYEWINDSIWGQFDISIKEYKYIGTVSERNKSDNSYQQTFDVYPRKLKPNSWFLIDFKPAELNKKHYEFLYVTDKQEFTFFPLKEVGD